MSLEKLMQRGKTIEVNVDGETVKLEVLKPNQVIWEKIRKMTEVETAKLKMSEELKKKVINEVEAMTDAEVIETLAVIETSPDFLKLGVKLEKEKFKDLETMQEIVNDPKAENEAKGKAQEYVNSYQKEFQKKIEKSVENKKAELKQVPIVKLREDLIREKIRVEAEGEAFTKVRLFQVGELCFYEGKKLKDFPDFDAFISRADDEVLNKILAAIDEITLGGLDIKKSLSQMTL